MPPRAQFTTRTPFLHWAKVLSLSKPGTVGRAFLQRWCRDGVRIPRAQRRPWTLPPLPPLAHRPSSCRTTALCSHLSLLACSGGGVFALDLGQPQFRNILNGPERLLLPVGSRTTMACSSPRHLHTPPPDAGVITMLMLADVWDCPTPGHQCLWKPQKGAHS